MSMAADNHPVIRLIFFIRKPGRVTRLLFDDFHLFFRLIISLMDQFTGAQPVECLRTDVVVTADFLCALAAIGLAQNADDLLNGMLFLFHR